MDHLNALNIRLAHERERLALAKTEGERTTRRVWVDGIQREIAAELDHLGLPPAQKTEDDALLDELFADIQP